MSVDYTYSSHIITEQFEVEQNFLSEYKANVYDFNSPYVILNPYLVAPLTALILFKTDDEESVSICVKGKNDLGDLKFSFPPAKEHQIPVYGLYADYNNTVILTLSSGARNIITIPTKPCPGNIATPSRIQTTPEYFEDNVMFLSPSVKGTMIAFDGSGDLRWYTSLNIVFDIKRLANGRFLVGTDRLVHLPYVVTGVYEMSMIGKIYNEYRLPGGVHHDYVEMEDGNIIMLTEASDRETVEDYCVLLDRYTGEIIKSWDLKAILPSDAGGGSRSSKNDWAHNNSVWYDKITNSLTFSCRNLDIIANVDFETGKINWLLGDPNKWPKEYVNKYFFTPDEQEEFDWFYAQHAAIILPDGDVFVFDNGAWRSKYADQDIPAVDKFSRGVRYHLDLEHKKVKQVWQYGKERKSEFFAPHISNVEYYAENHYMIHSGDIGNINGVPCVKPPIFYIGKPEEKDLVYYAITVEIKDNQVMYEMQIPGAYYRAKKMKLYCKEDRLTYGKGQLLGSLGATQEVRAKLPGKSYGILPEKFKGHIIDEEDRLKFSGVFESGTYCLLALTGADGSEHKYLIPAVEEIDELTLCVGTFQLKMAESSIMISKEGLSGQYEVKIMVENSLYNTGITINA